MYFSYEDCCDGVRLTLDDLDMEITIVLTKDDLDSLFNLLKEIKEEKGGD